MRRNGLAREHKPEELIRKPYQAEIVSAQSCTVVDVCRLIGIAQLSQYRWREEYGSPIADRAWRMNEPEQKNP